MKIAAINVFIRNTNCNAGLFDEISILTCAISKTNTELRHLFEVITFHFSNFLFSAICTKIMVIATSDREECIIAVDAQ